MGITKETENKKPQEKEIPNIRVCKEELERFEKFYYYTESVKKE